MQMKKLAAGLLCATLAIMMPAGSLLAAENRGAVIPVSYEDGNGKWNNTGVCFWAGESPALPVESATISADVYLPNEAVQVHTGEDEDFNPHSLNFRLGLSVAVDVEGEDKKIDLQRVGESFAVERDPREGVVCSVFKEEGPELFPYATAESRGDYVVVHIKNYPVNDEFIWWNEETQEEEPYTDEIPSGENVHYWMNTNINIGTDLVDFEGRFAYNNVSYTLGNSVNIIDFSERPDPEDQNIGDYWDDHNNQGFIQPVVFDDEYVINASSNNVKVKPGKTKKLTLSRMTPDSVVLIDVQKKKVAKVSVNDNGELVIKGKKKGTTKVFLTVDRTTKEILVKVK
jgi:hypothetical protein